ncbi:hypothetical protein [Neobacillus sp.]|uniref:hypothetical protein n=1 Tax=Neobacillus sp. TaxID=2675273 RepID=UPI0028A25475|nr:hypothetical protein [Neobacillus sp.]
MNSIKIGHAKKLSRKKTELYLSTATLREMKSWNLKISAHQSINELIQIHTDDITVIKEENNIYNISIKDGYLMTVLPKSELDDEFPVLISNSSPVIIVINTLLEVDLFKNFIEIKSAKISNNSTKIMNLKTLETIVSLVFGYYTLEETENIIEDFMEYIEKVLNSYEFYKVYSVKEIQELKRASICNSSISWYLIFKFFVENHQKNVYKYQDIPKLELDVCVNNWRGDFFDKKNPIWDEVFKTSRRFYPTKENLEKVYEKWQLYL